MSGLFLVLCLLLHPMKLIIFNKVYTLTSKVTVRDLVSNLHCILVISKSSTFLSTREDPVNYDFIT